MIAFLTSVVGGSYQDQDGREKPTYLNQYNEFTEQLRKHWKENSNVLIISAYPDEFEQNDELLTCLKEAFPMSGLSINRFDMCDARYETLVEHINEYDAILLSGGHVPTQNCFFERLKLKEKIGNYDGILMALSAGSMNCAKTVYAMPELEGEGIDPNYKRYLTGLGITEQMIIPHFQYERGVVLDGLRLMEDIAYPDSIGKSFLALNDGSYLVNENGVETVYGEAYRIKDGLIEQICKQDEFVRL